MFVKKSELVRGREATVISGLGECDLRDTFECGQAFRYELICEESDYIEYLTVAFGKLINVAQRKRGELIFFGDFCEEFEETVRKYFAFDLDFEAIRGDILSRTDSEWLKRASESAKGIVILKQEPFETLFSFIISQNNNIPRIRKIIRGISAVYGENLAEREGITHCPKTHEPINSETCRGCGVCFSFPTPESIKNNPEGLLPSRPGFRYKYLLDSVDKVLSGEVDLSAIERESNYEYTLIQLKKILGVGDKVASCVALFGFANLDAFPVDVWMKRAIEEYFDGNLDYRSLGKYAGVAQQYIFHYIRNLQKKEENVN